jgi:opacity protein-like surface antigen
MRFIKIALALAAVVSAGAAGAVQAQSPTFRGFVYGGVDSRREIQYEQPFEGSFYIGARGALNLANFKNEYSFVAYPTTDSDSYSFARQLGFEVAAGWQFARKWRAELSYGYSGKYEDKDSAADFSLSSQNFMANALYTIKKWTATNVYGGAGVGASLVRSGISGSMFLSDGKDFQTKATFAGQLMLGIEQDLEPGFAVGLQYRLMYGGGVEHRRNDIWNDTMITKIGGTLTNSVMIGARVKF